MSQLTCKMVDVSGMAPNGPDFWPPIRVPREAIDMEVERLASLPRPANGRRAALITHPYSSKPGLGFSPGIDVTINVLLPGEKTAPLRRNSSQVEICIRGRGRLHAGGREISMSKWDVCNIPSMQAYSHLNDSDEVWVRLSYSNAPLLEKLGVHYFEENPEGSTGLQQAVVPAEQTQRYARENAPDIELPPDGARIRGYEFLTDIQVVENKALHWPWERVSEHLSLSVGDNKRGILLLYNPATERRNGTTHSFFATMSSVPPGAPPRPAGRGHRHSSVAINYHFSGSGRSVVNGQEIEWNAGDLLLSAPGWSEHAHYVGPNGLGVLTVQDHPLHIGMESLIWQERMDGPILTLGAEPGQTGYVGPRQAGT